MLQHEQTDILKTLVRHFYGEHARFALLVFDGKKTSLVYDFKDMARLQHLFAQAEEMLCEIER